ncbi:MAG TPA: CHASE3 domain-containing protein [Myxococcaceae bacterium]|nr:CHASE3 domain-containing protein [Myxococcaceae bacterium]
MHAPHSVAEALGEPAPRLAGPPAASVQLAPAAGATATPAPLAHESVEFRRLLTRAFLVPAILLTLLAVALGGGVALLVRQAWLTQRSDQVLAHSARLRELLVDRETGLRGYLLSGDRSFLGPLERADGKLVDTLRSLRVLLHENPDQLARLDIVESMAHAWSQYAAREHALFESGDDYIRYFKAGEGVQRLSSMLEVLDTLGESEQARRRQRAEHAALTGRLLFWLSLGCVGTLALVLGYTSRRQLLALGRSHDEAVAAMEEREQAIRELNASLEQRVAERTQALAAVNAELEAFTSSVSHDLRAPLRQLGGFTRLLDESAGSRLDARERSYVAMLRNTAAEAVQMVDDLLSFSRVSRTELRRVTVDLNAVLASTREGLLHEQEGREVEWVVHPLPTVEGDPTMLLLVLRNLLGNALKYSRARRPARIEVGTVNVPGAEDIVYVRDNGVGFDMKYAHKLFGVFQRLHRADEFEGTGIGLAHARRIVQRHGGRVWGVGVPGQGATFYVALPRRELHPGELSPI